MNIITVQLSRNPLRYLRLLYSIHKIDHRHTFKAPYYATTVDAIDAFTIELVQRHRTKSRVNPFEINLSIRYFMDGESPLDISKLNTDELDNTLLQLMMKNREKQLIDILKHCQEINKNLSDITLKKLFRNYSIAGKPEVVEKIQMFCLKIDPYLYKRNGEFQHYLAKAQCMKGNSEKGLSILTDCYKKNDGLRSFYRIIFRELIHDSVLNRSEASLMIFKKYVLEFSEKWKDHYPLVCFWHICWSSSWFSDQTLSNDLLDSSVSLQEIVRDKATAFSISALRQEFNEDAVLRLLQSLIKYDMMEEYVKVLQVLFNYKLRNRDIRGCTEIIRNCEALGVNLPSDQQGRYIKMLIDGKPTDSKPTVPKNFKLTF